MTTPQSLDTVTLEAAAEIADGYKRRAQDMAAQLAATYIAQDIRALAIKPTPAGEGEELLGYVNVYRTEDGSLEMGATDFYETPQDAKDGDASEFEEVVGVGKVILLSSSTPAASPVQGVELQDDLADFLRLILLRGEDQSHKNLASALLLRIERAATPQAPSTVDERVKK